MPSIEFYIYTAAYLIIGILVLILLYNAIKHLPEYKSNSSSESITLLDLLAGILLVCIWPISLLSHLSHVINYFDTIVLYNPKNKNSNEIKK